VSREYLALEKIWYKKLKDTGFQDIEPPTDRLAVNSYLDGHYLEARKRLLRGTETGKSEVFRLAERWVQEEKFRSRADRIAFLLWSRGWDLTEVFARVDGLGKKGGFLWHHSQRVERMIAHYKSELAREALDTDPDELDEDEFTPTRIYTAAFAHGNFIQ
jgi:hypothetical protein